MESIEITDRGAAQIGRGVLWIYSNEIFKKPASLAPGTWCTFHCRSKPIATGYANPHSLIFGRVLALGHEEGRDAILRRRLEASFARRSKVATNGAARLVYSEADFMPGLIIDVYADHAVIQSNTAGIDSALPALESLVPAVFEKTFGRKLKGLLIKADSGIRRLEGVENFTRVASGSEDGFRSMSFEEEGTLFAADLVEGQKTGFFLDQRENRSFAAQWTSAGNKRVLDLCCYSGAWGLRMLKSGASQATFVDESADALKLVERGIALNKLEKSRARIVESDVFRFLENDENSYDVIVADPPAFIKTKKDLHQGHKAYEKLNRLAWRRLRPGGLLISCSCSFHMLESDLLTILQDVVGKEKDLAYVVYRGAQASDHPVLLSMPETRYLKCVALQKIDVSH